MANDFGGLSSHGAFFFNLWAELCAYRWMTVKRLSFLAFAQLVGLAGGERRRSCPSCTGQDDSSAQVVFSVGERSEENWGGRRSCVPFVGLEKAAI